MADWLETLKEGDEVVVSGPWSGLSLERITRASATQVAVGATKFRRSDGRQVGGKGYRFPTIKEPTPELRQKIAHDRVASKLAGMRPESWRALPLETLEAIAALIDGAAHG
jgi:hypothetical protein